MEQLRHRQRVAGEEIARRGKAREDAVELKAERKGVADEIKELDAPLQAVQARLEQIMLLLPNVPDPSVPVGPDASAGAPSADSSRGPGSNSSGRSRSNRAISRISTSARWPVGGPCSG